MEVPQAIENDTDGLEERLSGRASSSMSKGLCPTASTTENHEIIIKTQMSHDPVFLLNIYKVSLSKIAAPHIHNANLWEQAECHRQMHEENVGCVWVYM